MSHKDRPAFGAQFVELTVDTETGQVTVERVLMVVDAGRVINPITASGQVEGGLSQAVGFAHCEEMIYNEDGRLVNPCFGPYHVYRSNEMPKLETILVHTDEPTSPYGAKSVAGISMEASHRPWPTLSTTLRAFGSGKCPLRRSGCGGHCAHLKVATRDRFWAGAVPALGAEPGDQQHPTQDLYLCVCLLPVGAHDQDAG